MILSVGDSRKSSTSFLYATAQNQNPRAFQTFLVIVQRRGNRVNDVIRHRRIDFAGKLDEASRKVILACLPRR